MRGIGNILSRGRGDASGILCTLVCALVLSATLATGAAEAAYTHPFLGSFAAGMFSNPQGIAVDQASGDVYVYDTEAGKVYKFNAAGQPAEFSALKADQIEGVPGFGADEEEIAVDSVNGDIYVANGYVVKVYEEDGAQDGELSGTVRYPWAGEPCGVAVDAAGNVYVGLFPNEVDKYTPLAPSAPAANSDYVASLSLPGVDKVCNIAADAQGDVYVDTWPVGPVTKYLASQFGVASASGTTVDGAGSTLAIDPANNDLYVDEGADIAQFDAAGNLLGRWPQPGGEGAFSGSYGVAVSDFSKDVYAIDGVKDRVDIFGPEVLIVEAVSVGEESVSDVASTSATLSAQLNPGGASTSYRFEYGTSTAYGASVPVSEGQAGAGVSETTVNHELQGLEPGTTYHFRLAATNPLGTVYGADQVFTTQPSGGEFGLPDNRQYELVSPPQKDGAEVDGYDRYDGYGGVVQAAEDGGAITYLTSGPVGAGTQGNTSGTQVISTRSPAGGWSSRDIATPHVKPALEHVGHGEEYKLFSSDLSLGLVKPEGTTQLSSQAPAEQQNIYRWSAAGGSYEPLITSLPKTLLPEAETLEVLGASPDLAGVVFASRQALTANALGASHASGREPNLYFWRDGELQLINVLPEGPPTNGAVTEGEAGLGGHSSQNARRAISEDGSRVIWSDREGEEERNADIYIRETTVGKTVFAGRGEFQIASSDGSRVFYLQRERHNGEVESGLFEFDLDSGGSTQLVPAEADVQGVLGASEDGSELYVVAHGVLAQGATSGANNLYLLRESGGSWTTTFIATLASGDTPDWVGEGREPDLANVTSQVSPDGRYLAFMSSERLTGYDNRDANSGQPDVEVYLYDSSSGRLACVSCDPTGARPVGESDYNEEDDEPIPMDIPGAWAGQWLAGAIRGWTEVSTGIALYQSRELSDSGRLFFDSSDALVPHDTNGREDVYEYEPEGIGSCGLANGCVSLISAGTGSADSIFMDASANGEDVFFITRDRLVGEDFDNSYDMYDAHVCSASEPCPALAPVAPPPCTTGDSCKPSPSPQPATFASPASATFSGAGNLTQPPPKSSAKAKKHKPKHRGKKNRGHKGKRAKRSEAAKKSSGGAKR